MLTEQEKNCLKGLLQYLTPADLKALAKTVSKGLLKINTPDECLKAIFTCSKSVTSLLSRQKIKKEYLFSYLTDSGVSVLPGGKLELVNCCLKYWGQNKISELEQLDDDVFMDDVSEIEIQHQPANVPHINVSPQPQTLAEQFVNWFYPLLNEEANPANPPLTKLDPNHFWSDSTCAILLLRTNQENKCEAVGSRDSVLLLSSLVRQEHVLLNPSTIPGGVKCFCEPHGLVKLNISGTVQGTNQCFGMFDQEFGLLQSIQDERWKIKYTKLLLRICAQ